MELGFLYDVLYTKATIIHSCQDWGLHIFVSLSLVLCRQSSQLLTSISTPLSLWFTKHATISIGRAITFIQLPKQPRWSNSMSRFNLLSFSIKDKHVIFYGIQKLLCIDKVLEMNEYTTCSCGFERIDIPPSQSNLKPLFIDNSYKKHTYLLARKILITGVKRHTH